VCSKPPFLYSSFQSITVTYKVAPNEVNTINTWKDLLHKTNFTLYFFLPATNLSGQEFTFQYGEKTFNYRSLRTPFEQDLCLQILPVYKGIIPDYTFCKPEFFKKTYDTQSWKTIRFTEQQLKLLSYLNRSKISGSKLFEVYNGTTKRSHYNLSFEGTFNLEAVRKEISACDGSVFVDTEDNYNLCVKKFPSRSMSKNTVFWFSRDLLAGSKLIHLAICER